MGWNFKRIKLFKLILTISLSINWIGSQDIQDNSFFDGPHLFYHNDSLNIIYYNYGVKDSFQLDISDTVTFSGYFQDSLVNYVVPQRFSNPSDKYNNIDSIFVISDLHGQFDIFKSLLNGNGIIDQSNLWTWGNGHLVVLGDIFDRGNKVHEILWLIYQLEIQAREAGGMVHVLLGNHEIMVLQNDLRYVDEKYFTISEQIDIEVHNLYDEDTFWGRWLRSKNFITIIDPYLFVHGGIHPDLINKYNSINEINRIMRNNIDTDRDDIRNNQDLSDLFLSEGPIWYRGFFEPDSQPDISKNDLINIFDHFGVEKIIVGHTTNDSIYTSFDDGIINVDGGIKYGIQGEGLLILKNKFYRASSNGSQHLLF